MANRNKNREQQEELNPILLEKWVENRSIELQIQAEQIKHSHKQLDHDRVIAEKTIDAQLEDRARIRASSEKLSKYVMVFLGIVLFMLLVFGGFVIVNDKESLLSEIIGLVVELCKYGIGAVTGYFVAKSNFKKNNQSEDND